MPDLGSLKTALGSADDAQRLAAAEELCQLAEEAQPAAVALVKASGDESEDVREQAVAALEALGAPQLEDIVALVPLLAAGQADVAYWAATLLGRLESDAADAAPALASVLQGAKDSAVQQRAAWALGKIGPAATDSVPHLQKAATSADPRLARLAQEAIEQIRGQS